MFLPPPPPHPPAKRSFRGVYCFQHVRHSVLMATFNGFALYFDSFCPICSNLHHTLTIRQCMFKREKGAEGSVLQELCHFVILAIRCLYYDIVHTLWTQLILELSLDLFNTLQLCYRYMRYMEDVHKEVWCWKNIFWQTDRVFNLAIFWQLHLVNNGW